MLCCTAFENLITDAGERGLAALVKETTNSFRFVIQMRAVSFADEPKLPQEPQPLMPEHLTISASMIIRYCPFCGKNLEDLIATDAQTIKKLADKHKYFHNNWG